MIQVTHHMHTPIEYQHLEGLEDSPDGQPASWDNVEYSFRFGYWVGYEAALITLKSYQATGMPSAQIEALMALHKDTVLQCWARNRPLKTREIPPVVDPLFMQRDQLTLKERIRVVESFDRVCCYCNRRSSSVLEDPDGASWHVDHRIPVSKGGSNHPANLALACAYCNLRKGAGQLEMLKGGLVE